jgi:pimeloyl-ACP methyl ester carboxylesterase
VPKPVLQRFATAWQQRRNRRRMVRAARVLDGRVMTTIRHPIARSSSRTAGRLSCRPTPRLRNQNDRTGRMFSTKELPKLFCDVHGKKMDSEVGSGPPIVFCTAIPLHPISGAICNIMPHIAPQARCIAPDLIGMGDSEKLGGADPDRYGFLQHRRWSKCGLHVRLLRSQGCLRAGNHHIRAVVIECPLDDRGDYRWRDRESSTKRAFWTLP